MEAYCEFVTTWEDICSVVSEDKVKKINEEIDEVKVLMKLSGSDFDIEDLFVYFRDSTMCDCRRDLDKIKEKVESIKQIFDSVLSDFNQKTGVDVRLSLLYDNIDDHLEKDQHYTFILNWNKMFQFSPMAEKIKEMGVNFNLNHWSERY